MQGSKTKTVCTNTPHNQDIFLLGLRPLSDKLMNQLLSHLVLPVLIGSLVDVEHLVEAQQDINDQYARELNRIDGENFNENNHNKVDDDTQKASAIRKFLESRTRISKQLALFLLTQVLSVFSDGRLCNAIIVCLIHPYPPKLVNQIILQPPQHAVESSIPISHVLCQKTSYFRKRSVSGPSTPQSECIEDQKDSHRSDIMKEILNNDENAKIQRSRIESVELMDIVHEDSVLPEDSNIYRNGLLNMLKSDPTQTENEQLIASAAALILTIIRVEIFAFFVVFVGVHCVYFTE